MYDHATKAGNRGDIWKHAILVDVFGHMLGTHRGMFHYEETHAGQGRFLEVADDQWLQKFRSWTEGNPFPLFRDMLAPTGYDGSWVLVAKVADYCCRTANVTLHEINRSLYADMAKALMFGSGSKVIADINCPSDGFKECSHLANLTLIDPPYENQEEDLKNACALGMRLMSVDQPFILWTPSIGNQLIQMRGGPKLYKYDVTWGGGGCCAITHNCPPIAADRLEKLRSILR